MILDLILIIIFGYFFGKIFNKLKLPKIIGMIIFGIIIGKSGINILNDKTYEISKIIRNIALLIIITRAGLSLNIKTLKEIGRPALLLSFLPALLEILGVFILAPLILNITYLDSLLLGSVMAAVSPAIIVPRMIKLKEEKYGEDKNIPELIMASSSIDDILVITIFTTVLSLILTNNDTTNNIIGINFLKIILSIILGIILGFLINELIKKISNKTINTLIIISTTLILIIIKKYLIIDELITILITTIIISTKNKEKSLKIENNYKKYWFIFEILLFVLVGSELNLEFAIKSGIKPLIIIAISLIFRIIGIIISLIKTKYNKNEKRFIIYSLLPKATVQASIGAIALQNNLKSGEIILTLAVLSILITAPIGAYLIDNNYKKLLKKDMI